MITGNPMVPSTSSPSLSIGADLPVTTPTTHDLEDLSSPPGYLSPRQLRELQTLHKGPARNDVFLQMEGGTSATQPADASSRVDRAERERQSEFVQATVHQYVPRRGLFTPNARALFAELTHHFLFDAGESKLHGPYARLLENDPLSLAALLRHCERVARQLDKRGMPASAFADTLASMKFCDAMVDAVKAFISAVPFAGVGPALLPYPAAVDKEIGKREKDEQQKRLQVLTGYGGTAGPILGSLDHVFARLAAQIGPKHQYGDPDTESLAAGMKAFVDAHASGDARRILKTTVGVSLPYSLKNFPVAAANVVVDLMVGDSTQRGAIKEIVDCVASLCAGTMVPTVLQRLNHGNTTFRDLLVRRDAADRIWTAYENYVRPDRLTVMANMREAGCTVACKAMYDMYKYAMPMNWILDVPKAICSDEGRNELSDEMRKISSWIPPITKDLASAEMLWKMIAFTTYTYGLIFTKAAIQEVGDKRNWNQQSIDLAFDLAIPAIKPACYLALVSSCMTAGLVDRSLRRHFIPFAKAWVGWVADKVNECRGRGGPDDVTLTSVVTSDPTSTVRTESSTRDLEEDDQFEDAVTDTDITADVWHDAPAPDEPSTPPHPVPVGPPQHG